MNHKLTQICFFESGNLESLTFKFNDDQMSPPPGTYWNEPNAEIPVPDGWLTFRRLEFLTHRVEQKFWIYAFKIIDHDLKTLVHLMPKKMDKDKSQGIDLSPSEQLVSIGVEAGTQDPAFLTFLIFDWKEYVTQKDEDIDFESWHQKIVENQTKQKNKLIKKEIKHNLTQSGLCPRFQAIKMGGNTSV